MSEDFDKWADFYRIWTDVAPYNEDVFFYKKMSEQSNGLVADLGIGVGRVAADVAPTYGVDISEEMLREARRRIGDVTELILASIVDLRLPQPVSFQYCAQNTLNHVPDGEQYGVFQSAWVNSVPGGRFVLEAALLMAEHQRARDRVPVLRANDGLCVIHDITRLLDSKGRQAELTGILEVLDESGIVRKRRYFPPIHFTFLTVDEISKWARDAGWQIEGVYADFAGGQVEPDSSSAVWVLRKPTGNGIP